MADAALKSYWRRKALALFLRRCGVAEGFLATWPAEETKRDLLHRLFPRVEASGDAGLRLINRMADALIQQTSFPDLSGWENSDQKLLDAKAAVKALKEFRDAQHTQAATEREKIEARKRAEEINAEIRARAADLNQLETRLAELSQELGTSGAGHRFEDWFYSMTDYFDVISRRPYKTNGREIDGSVTIDGTTYLVELKFTGEQAGAPEIDIFFKKVTTKADNTMGVMFSIYGYSSVAVREASGPKCLLLLFDHSHIYMLLHGSCTFEDLICRVRRHSSQTGESYLPARFINA